MTIDEMIEVVRKHPGWTLPGWEMTPEKIEYVRMATGTVVEYNEGGSPRFMPADEYEAEVIRQGWRNAGLDVTDYGSPQ